MYLAELDLHCCREGSLELRRVGALLFSCSEWALIDGGGFSWFRAWAQSVGSVVVANGPSYPWHVWSPQTRIEPRPQALGGASLNWTTREVSPLNLKVTLLKGDATSSFNPQPSSPNSNS